MPKYHNAVGNIPCSTLLYKFLNNTTPRSRRIIIANLICIFLLLVGLIFVPRGGQKFLQDVGTVSTMAVEGELFDQTRNVYYISKRALCSRSIAHDRLGIQPIAVSKVILRPVVRHQNSEDFDDRLEVLPDAMVNDVAFLDRNVTGMEAELSAHVCPLHTVSILPPRKPTRYTASNLVFGVTLRADDVPGALQHWRYWARESGVKLHVLLPSLDSSRVSEVRAMIKKELGINVVVESARDTNDFANLTLILVQRMEQSAKHGKEWFVILAPGTFVTSVEDILLALEPHDSTERLYLGAVSESTRQKDKYGSFAYGGAGIVLSRTLIRAVAVHIPDCIPTVAKAEGQEPYYGDGLLSNCLAQYTSANFTLLPALHQCDVEEDISGILQAPLEFATLHNLIPGAFSLFPSWHQIGPESSYRSTYQDQLGLFYEARNILSPQNWGIRYRFGSKGRYLLTNGYSITEFLRPPYPTNYDIRNGVEGTFANDNDVEEFTFHAPHGNAVKELPMRRGLREGDDKRTYYLRAIGFTETQASVARVLKMNRQRREAVVFIYINEMGSVRRGVEVIWL